jgi:hypothetical protein
MLPQILIEEGMTYASISGIWNTISVIPLRKLILFVLGLLEQAISI